MDLGFETIGNAAILCHDHGPLLVTDPWLQGGAYFGSWVLSHKVPEEQWETAKQCPYAWISHGHPDHLSLPSLEILKAAKPDKTWLVPDHYGGRIVRELAEHGFEVTVMKDGEWMRISDRVRICSMANYNQDAVLLIEMDDSLIVDANDAGDRGASKLFREILGNYRRKFLACLTGWGDADMINFFDEEGRRVLPLAAAKTPVGPQIAHVLEHYGFDFFAVSSSLHRYARTDSVWANEFATPHDMHSEGFASQTTAMLPAFVKYDLIKDECTEINPPVNNAPAKTPESCDDSWSDELSKEDVQTLTAYLKRVTHLQEAVGFVNFRCGAKDNVIDLNRKGFERGITFETPRNSLMQAVEWNAFDDILIANFCKTTMHGTWEGGRGEKALYPHFTPFVTKFGDNGGAFTAAEIRAYFEEYARRGFTDFHPDPAGQELEWLTMEAVRAYVPEL